MRVRLFEMPARDFVDLSDDLTAPEFSRVPLELRLVDMAKRAKFQLDDKGDEADSNRSVAGYAKRKNKYRAGAWAGK